MADFASIIRRVKRPTASVVLCLDADLFGEYQALDAQLRSTSPAASLAGSGPEADAIMAQMDALRARMVDSEVTFRFQALPSLDFANLRAKMPSKKDGQSDDEFINTYHEWVCEVVAAAALDPVMTAGQADELASALADAQWRQVRDAAWEVNNDLASIPFSVTASVLNLNSAGKSRQPEPSDNPEAGSLAGNQVSGSTSSGTTTATSPAGRSPRKRSGPKKTANS